MKGKLLGTAAILSGGAGVVDGFGNFNLTLNYIDGFFNAASQVQLPADQHERDIWVGDKHAAADALGFGHRDDDPILQNCFGGENFPPSWRLLYA